MTAATDLELPTPGFPLVLSRSYESTHAIDGPLGYGWTSSLAAHLYYATYLLAAPDVVKREADITMPDGARYKFVENSDGTFVPPLGRYDTLVRNPDGSFDLTPQRTSARLHFGADGSLLNMIDEYGNQLTLSYDANGRLQRIEDMAGSLRYLDVYWGADGRISSIQDSAGRQVGYAYGSSGVLTDVSDPLGRTSTYSYVAGKYVPLLAAARDSWNRLLTEVTYDPQDRVTSYSENGEQYTYTFNYQGNPAKTAKQDSAGNTWVFTHGIGGLVISDVAPGGLGTKSTTYYADGSIQQQTDQLGRRTYLSYDAQGRLQSLTKDYQGPAAIRFDVGYDSSFPNRISSLTPRNPVTGSVDSNWQAWRYDYYQQGSPAPGALHHVYRVQVDGVTLDTMATYSYDSHGRLLSWTDADGATTNYNFDAQGNLASEVRPANNDVGTRPIKAYRYDSLGRVTAVTDAIGAETTFDYDALDRLVAIALVPPAAGSPPTHTMTYSYDNFDSAKQLAFKVATDPNGRTTQDGIDAHGRLVEHVDALGALTRYGYSRDLLATITDAHGYVTTYLYDILKRRSSAVFPDGGVETYVYHPDGSLWTKEDRKNQTITYAYDRLGRLALQTYAGGGSISYTYVGQSLTQVVDARISPAESHVFAYDGAYRLASESQADRGTLTYTYSNADRLLSYAVVDGESAIYTYYPDGSVDTIAWSPVPGEFKFAYDGRGEYQQITFPNGQHRDYSYDAQGRPVHLGNIHPVTGILAAYEYGWDIDNMTAQPGMLGLRTSQVATVPAQGLSNALTKYYYDGAYSLRRVEYPSAAPFNGEVREWTYDLMGNRLTETVNGQTDSYVYQTLGTSQNNWDRLVSAGGTSYSFDANGSVLSVVGATQETSFTWDVDNRPVTQTGSNPSTSRYDNRGRRSVRTENGQTFAYLYRDDTPIRMQGGVTAEFLVGPLRDELLATFQDGVAYFAVVDDHDSIVALADAAGAIRRSTVYDAWGSARTSSGDVQSHFGHLGREAAGADLWLNDVRYYSPAIGRFLQEDPGGLDASSARQWRAGLEAVARRPIVGGRGQMNVGNIPFSPRMNQSDRSYVYGRNSPAMFRDPGGRWSIWVLVGKAVVVYEIINAFECFDEQQMCLDVCYVNECDGCKRIENRNPRKCHECYQKCFARANCVWTTIKIPVTHLVWEWIAIPYLPVMPAI